MAKGNNRAVDRPYKFDQQAQARFLAHYAEFGVHYRAAEAAGVSGQTVYDHAKKDEEFAAAFEEAKGFFRNHLEHEARRRALEGCVEYYVQGGKVVTVDDTDENGDPIYLRHPDTGEVLYNPNTGEPLCKQRPLVRRVYSDKLMELLLKRHIPEFRDKQQVDLNVNTGVLRVEHQVSREDWEARLEKLRDRQAGFPSIVEGELAD